MDEDTKKKSYDMGSSFQTAFPVTTEVEGFDKRKVAAAIVIFLAVAAAISVPTVLLTMKKDQDSLPVGENDRIECPFSEGEPSWKECLDKGCQWNAASVAPSCYHPKASNYFVMGPRRSTIDGFEILLEFNSNVTLFGNSSKNVIFRVSNQKENQLTLEIAPDSNISETKKSHAEGLTNYEVVVNDTVGAPFNFAVMRKDNSEKIWDSSLNGLILEEQFLQISTYLPSGNIYGLGENVHNHFKRDLNYNAWNMFSRHPDNSTEHKNLGGFHPFYMCLENSGKAHTVFFHNTHATEYILLPAPGITWRTIGGTLKFTIFLGNSPVDAVRLSTSLLGTPAIIPYWALGFQITPKSAANFEKIVNEAKRTIPVDAVYLEPHLWTDDQIFDQTKIVNKDIIDFVKNERNSSTHFVITLDPAIRADDYEAFNDGMKADVFSKWPTEIGDQSSNGPPGEFKNLSGTYVFGTRDPMRPTGGLVAFPDFWKSSTENWWLSLLSTLWNSLPFEGLHLVGNEPYSVGNERTQCNPPSCWTLKCPQSEWDNPPYTPSGRNGKLSDGTVCMSTIQGTKKHYESHNVYGMKMAQISAQHFTRRLERTFIVSQSTSSLKIMNNPAGHWLGSFPPTWSGLRKTIVGVLDLNLFGIPYVGSDICGDGRLPSDDNHPSNDLCARWIQLAAFYPFLKVDVYNSNWMSGRIQSALSSSLALRYSLLPYFYTVFYKSHLEGDPVIRPLFYEYPNETETLSIETQFLWGKNIMVAPVLDEGLHTLRVYFPDDIWYRLRKETSSRVTYLGGKYSEVGEIRDLPVFIRGGTILACHAEELVKNVADSRGKYLVLKVFPANGKSSGFLYWDDGVTKDTWKTSRYLSFEFEHEMTRVTIQRTEFYQDFKDSLSLHQILIHDVGPAESVTLNGQETSPPKYLSNFKILTLQVDIELTANVTEWIIEWKSSQNTDQDPENVT